MRRALSQENFVKMLLAQGAVIPCGKCKLPITNPKNIRREHLNELEISRDDSVKNQQLWHAVPCSHIKTYGTKATTLGSSAHIIAKARRMDRRNAGLERQKRKIRSRGFSKVKRRMRGKKPTEEKKA